MSTTLTKLQLDTIYLRKFNRSVPREYSTILKGVTKSEISMVLNSIRVKQLLRAVRETNYRNLVACSVPLLEKLAKKRSSVLSGLYAGVCPSYAGGTTTNVHVVTPLHAPGAMLTTHSSWKDYGTKYHRVATGILTISISSRLATAIRKGRIPAVISGVANIDAVKVRGGWKVTTIKPYKGQKDKHVKTETCYVVKHGNNWVHGPTIAEAKALAVSFAKALVERTVNKKRELHQSLVSQASATYGRAGKIAAQALLRGSLPPTLTSLHVIDRDRITANLCKVGTSAWLARNGCKATAIKLPLSRIVRMATRFEDETSRLLSVVVACLRRNFPKLHPA